MGIYNPYIDKPIEYDYLITPDGKTYSFHDGVDYFTLSVDGLDEADNELIEQRGPGQHGTTVLDYRLQPRLITLLHRRRGCSRTNYWQIRRDMVNHTRINRQLAGEFNPWQFRKVLPDGTTLDIDVYPRPIRVSQRQLNKWDEWGVTAVCRFYAPDPTFYNPIQVVRQLSIEGCDNLIFPFSFPFVFCGDRLNQTDAVTYLGNWVSHPIVYARGPIYTGATLANVTTGHKLEFRRNLDIGRQLTIDTRPGYHTVTDELGQNAIDYLTPDSDLELFGFYPDPTAPGGVNVISANALFNVIGQTAFTVTYNTRYLDVGIDE